MTTIYEGRWSPFIRFFRGSLVNYNRDVNVGVIDSCVDRMCICSRLLEDYLNGIIEHTGSGLIGIIGFGIWRSCVWKRELEDISKYFRGDWLNSQRDIVKSLGSSYFTHFVLANIAEVLILSSPTWCLP